MGRYEVTRIYRKTEQTNQRMYDPQDDQLALINPTVINELYGNGSFEFEMPSSHQFYRDINLLTDEIMVRDTFVNETIFVGRPISYEETDLKRAKVFCEGSLAYLHDVLHRPNEWNDTTPEAFFNSVITAYNTRKREVFGSDFQKVIIGECDIPNRTIYRNAEWDEIYTLIEKGCVDSDGGYLIMSYDESGHSTLNWRKNLTDSTWQSAEVGTNLVSIDENVDLSEAATAFIPIGPRKTDAEGNRIDERVMLSDDVNSQVTSGQSNDIAFWRQYGYIEKAIEYSDDQLTNSESLLSRMKQDSEYLLALPWENGSIECVVADLHFLDRSIPKFKIGQEINTNISRFKTYAMDYLQNQKTYVTKITTRLDSAVPEITIGTLRRQTISDQFKKSLADSEEVNKLMEEFASDELQDLESRLEDLEDDYYGDDGSGGSSGLIEDIYIYMGTFEYEDSELEETDPATEGYTKVSDLSGGATYQKDAEVASNYRIRFKMPIGDDKTMDLTIDINSSDLSRDSAGTLLKKTKKYYNGDACIINFRLTYEKNQGDEEAHMTAMTLVSAYYARSNVTDSTTWSVWHD